MFLIVTFKKYYAVLLLLVASNKITSMFSVVHVMVQWL